MGEAGGTVALFQLLSPYVTLATNEEPAQAGRATDAIKVLYTADPQLVAAMLAPGDAHRLSLPDADERRAVIAVLQRSSEMLHPTARSVGALRVGYLPVAPTWD